MSERWGWVEQVRRATAFVRPHWKTSLLILLLALVGAGLNAAEPLALMYVFDGLTGDRALRAVVLGVVALGGIALVRELTSALSNWLGWRTRLDLKHELLERTVGRLSLLPVSFHSQERVGATMTRLDRGIGGFVSALMEIVSKALSLAGLPGQLGHHHARHGLAAVAAGARVRAAAGPDRCVGRAGADAA